MRLTGFIKIAAVVALAFAVPGAAAQALKPLSARQIQGLVAGGVDSHRIAVLVERRGIDFEPGPEYLQALRKTGADDALIDALKKARRILPAPAKPESAPKPAAPPPVPQVTVADLLRSAHNFEQAQKWPEAARDYRSALAQDPHDAEVHLSLARVLEKEEKPDDAAAEYRQALAIDPKNGEAEYELGALDYAQGHLDDAVAAFRAAAELQPRDASIQKKLGMALYVAGDLDGAITAYREAVRLEPSSAEAHNDLGDALLKKGERLEALEEYHKAFDLAPNDSTFRATYAEIAGELQHHAATKTSPQGSRE